MRSARLLLQVHPYMLRHTTCDKLANDGRDTRAIQHYIGGRNVEYIARYTELTFDRFGNFYQNRRQQISAQTGAENTKCLLAIWVYNPS